MLASSLQNIVRRTRWEKSYINFFLPRYGVGVVLGPLVGPESIIGKTCGWKKTLLIIFYKKLDH